MTEAAEVRAALLALETELLDPAVRRSRSRLDALLADEFVEFGSSGRIFDKRSIIALLLAADSRDVLSLCDFRMVAATGGQALASYTCDAHDGNGERLLVNHSDPLLFRGLPDLEGVAVDAVMTDTRWPEGALAALGRARDMAVPAVLDYDRDAERLRSELLSTATHVAFGRQGLAALAGADDVAAGLHAVRRMTDAWLACTAGGDGVHWLDGDTVRHLPAFPVRAVDTLGAGDVFHGALALALAEGMPEAEALRFASAAAAVKCTRFGGGAVSPTRAELAAFLGETV